MQAHTTHERLPSLGSRPFVLFGFRSVVLTGSGDPHLGLANQMSDPGILKSARDARNPGMWETRHTTMLGGGNMEAEQQEIEGLNGSIHKHRNPEFTTTPTSIYNHTATATTTTNSGGLQTFPA